LNARRRFGTSVSRLVGIVAFVTAAPFACAQPLSLSRMLHSIDATTPAGAASAEQSGDGWASRLWDGTKRIWTEGRHDVYLSGFVWHMPYSWTSEKRARFNDDAWGLGYGRSVVDARDNERMLFAIVAQDSYRRPMVMAGYAWVARWPVAGNVRVGAGYSALLVRHESTSKYPLPLAAPVVSLGNEHVGVYVAYLYSMTYFVGKISFD
jgi:palmitoyl transferase